jgi:hypothetical protein
MHRRYAGCIDERRETEQQHSLAARPRGRDLLIQCGLNHKNVDWVHTDTP